METPKLEFDFNEAFTEYELSQIRVAMKQEAIAFAEWQEKKKYYLVAGGMWLPNPPKTTEQLYDLYLESKKQKV